MTAGNPPFEVFKYNASKLKNLLANDSDVTLKVVGNKGHSSYLEDYFKKLCAETILVENEYVDRDFLEDYAGYYVRCFHLYPRKCTRLHFFNINFSREDFEKLLKSHESHIDQEGFNSAYLGFIVVKPLPQTTIGRTCLRTYATEGNRFFPVIRKYNVHLFGITLKIESLSFQQQDRVVAACATSALWSAFHRTGTLFHHNIPSPLEITKAATLNATLNKRTLPNSGLDIYQMANAIRSVGLEPYTLSVEYSSYNLKNILFAYLRGKIPLVLVIDMVLKSDVESTSRRPRLHAVTISGYNLGLKEASPYGKSEFSNKASCINKIYVHDDQVGPFARMGFHDVKVKVVNINNEEIFVDSLSTSWSDGSVAVPKQILIPLYHKIRIPLDVIHEEIVAFDIFIEIYRTKKTFLLSKRLEWDIQLITVCEPFYQTSIL